jgi:VanZ family protein
MASRHPEQLGWRAMLRIWSWRAALLSILGTVAVAGIDEWHQSFLSNRGGSAKDVMLDGMGCWLAQIGILLGSIRIRKRIVAPVKTTLTSG